MSCSPAPAESTLALVSIIIPCYNAARYLGEAIESCLGQSYSKIEVIVVDDGSSDATSTIAQSYAVTCLRQPNRGVSAARNNGLQHSKGKYVLFLDHDDRLIPRAVEMGVDLLEKHPECAIAVGEHRYISPDGRELGYSNKRATGANHYEMLLERNFIETPGSALHRRSVIDAIGVFDETVLGAEDYELYLRTARNYPLIGHKALVSEYRLHEASCSRNGERMMMVSHQVLQMELPYLAGDPAKLRIHQRGIKFARRHFGRRLTRELMGNRELSPMERRRKLKVLERHYPAGFAAVLGSRLLPQRLVRKLLAA
jgi:Glycosyl transferase family 2